MGSFMSITSHLRIFGSFNFQPTPGLRGEGAIWSLCFARMHAGAEFRQLPMNEIRLFC